MINLQEFLDGYKISEIELGDKKRKFREPVMKDIKLRVDDMLTKYILEGDINEFFDIINNQLTRSQQNELIKTILKDLGLV